MDSGLVGLHVKGVLSDRLLTNQEFTNIGRGRPFLGPQDDKASHTMKNKNGGLGLLCGARWTRGLAPALRPLAASFCHTAAPVAGCRGDLPAHGGRAVPRLLEVDRMVKKNVAGALDSLEELKVFL